MKAKRKRKIGEILLENNFITQDILDEALNYQKEFGGSITQYLIAYGYINEEALAKCLSEQFDFPYLPLRVYNVSSEAIDLVPVGLVEKYWLMPVDRMKGVLTVVMADPFDTEAIEELEKVTGCKVQQFVGILSDIIYAIERYYNIIIEDKSLKKKKPAPLVVDTKIYKGFERRKSVRLKVKIDVHFPSQEIYKRARAKDISLHGILFESPNALPLRSYVTLQIDLPKDVSPFPIACVVQVVRVAQLKSKKFDIGAKMVRIPEEDAKTLIKYARAYEEKT